MGSSSLDTHHSVLLQQAVALCGMNNSLLAVALESLEASEQNASREHETQVRLRSLFFRADEQFY